MHTRAPDHAPPVALLRAPQSFIGRAPGQRLDRASAGRPRVRASWAPVLLGGFMVASLAVPLVGCGGSSSPSVRSTPAEASGSTDADKSPATPAGGALSAQLARALPADGASTAVVAFAVFRPAVPADLAREQKIAEAAVKANLRVVPPTVSSVARRPMPDPEVIIAPVDGELPLDLPALIAGAGEAAPLLEKARAVWIVGYAGRVFEHDAQVRAVALGAWAFAIEGSAVVDLGTRRAWTRAEYLEWIKADDWMADQVTVDAEQAEDGTVTFFTRGMARFGQPDLEAAKVPAAEARERFAEFQALLAALRAHGPAKPGDTVGGVTLGRCVRPPEAIERTCVSM